MSPQRIPAQSSAAGLQTAGRCKSVICGETVRLGLDRWGSDLLAIILTGSQARNEGTFVPRGAGWAVCGDAEFVFVFKNRGSVPARADIDRLRRDVQDALVEQRITCTIGLSAVEPSFLRRAEPSIFAYELRERGEVLSGDTQILQMMSRFQAADIPIEDGWRLLQNRIVEMLDFPQDCAFDGGVLPEQIRYRTTKLYLDMATSLLLFVGEYAPSYRERARHLQNLQWDVTAAPPFLTGDFLREVCRCTEWKVSGEGPGLDATWKAWEEAVVRAHQMWRWEVAILAGCSSRADDRELMAAWMRRQSLPGRLRGWLYALREQGFPGSARQCSRWAKRASKGSPRYWIYAAANEFLFGLPDALRRARPMDGNVRGWRDLLEYLPIETRLGVQSCDWRQIAGEIFWNYQQLLMETRV